MQKIGCLCDLWSTICCREWVPAPKGETAGENGDVDKRAAADVALTLESWKAESGGGGYSGHSMMKSASFSSSKCIDVL